MKELEQKQKEIDELKKEPGTIKCKILNVEY